MVRSPESDPIDYLIRRRFPRSNELCFPPTLSTDGSDHMAPEIRALVIAQIKAHKNKASEQIARGNSGTSRH